MGEFKKGDKVIRINKSAYDLNKTKSLLQEHFQSLSHASTIEGVEGDDVVLYADEDGALIQYTQSNGYKGLGYLYYVGKYLELAKRPEEIINNYELY